MNKRVVKFFFILIALFVGAFYYTDIAQKPILSALNNLKISYHSSIEFILNGFNKHFFQVDTINNLNKKLQKYENILL